MSDDREAKMSEVASELRRQLAFPPGVQVDVIAAIAVDIVLSPPNEPRTGVDMIAAERRRQIEAEGYTPEHDDEHPRDMAKAAWAYCWAAVVLMRLRDNPPSNQADADEIRAAVLEGSSYWPWEPAAWKPTDDPVRALTKAGALVAAELDRLLRASTEADR